MSVANNCPKCGAARHWEGLPEFACGSIATWDGRFLQSLRCEIAVLTRERDSLKANLDFAEEDVAIAKRKIAELEAEVARLKEENERLVRISNQVIDNFGYGDE